MRKLFFIRDISSPLSIIFDDLYKDKRVTVLDGPFKKQIKSPFVSRIRRAHYSREINSIVKLPLKKIWGGENYLMT